jgi:hypothetical protein
MSKRSHAQTQLVSAETSNARNESLDKRQFFFSRNPDGRDEIITICSHSLVRLNKVTDYELLISTPNKWEQPTFQIKVKSE